MRLKTVVGALSWKIFLQWRKHWIATIFQILFPTVLFGLLVYLKGNLPTGRPKEHQAQSFENVEFLDTIYFPKVGENRTKIDLQQKVILFAPSNDLTEDIMTSFKLAIHHVFPPWSNNLGKF